jgi:hypothetical protein
MKLCPVCQYMGLVLKADGTTMDLTLKDVLYIPKLKVNKFSLTKALETQGVKLSSQGQLISLINGQHEICFDKVFKHGSGRLLGIDFHPNPINIAVTVQTLDINTVYILFGHPNSQVLLLQHRSMVSRQRAPQCLFQLCHLQSQTEEHEPDYLTSVHRNWREDQH